MKEKKQKIIVLVLSLCILVGVLTGCDKNAKAEKSKVSIKTITDQNGRDVNIPSKISKVVTTNILPFPSAYFIATGSCDNLVGIHPASKSAAAASMLSILSPKIMKANTDFIKGNDINLEELLKLDPDIVFFLGTNKMELEKVDKSGIPGVAIQTMSIANGDSLETLNSWLELLGKITGKGDRADKIIAYGRETQQMIDEKLKSVSDEKKLKGLMIFTLEEKNIEVSGSGFFGHHWLIATGAIDVSEEIKIKAKVDMEQIYKWNPEIIYITNFTQTQPEDLINNKINGQDWSKVRAVQDKKVYKIPLGVYRWFPPSGDTPLMLKWLAQKNHPEVFSDYKIEEEIKDYYSMFYNYKLSDKQVEMILNPARAAAEGYSSK